MRGALIVGIDHYNFGTLLGCINDANNLAKLLARNENNSLNFQINLLTSDKYTITRSSLIKEIEQLFSKEGDVALFYFSGHGTENNLGGYIVTSDSAKYNEGVSLSDILQYANQSQAREKIIILDSCNSGHLGELPGFKDSSFLNKGVTIITATKGNEKAIQRAGSSLFTSLLLDALEGNASDILGKTPITSIYYYIERSLGYFGQTPMYKSNVSRFISIRDCEPSVNIEILRSLPQYFTSKDTLFQLDPSFEPTCIEAFIEENGTIFSYLQKCRAAGLIEPIPPTEHLYYAAMKSESCRLTKLGKYYWFLALNERI